MTIKITEDIRSVTELKRNMKEVLAHVHKTKRPVILTVNGKADAVLMDAKTYELHISAMNLARLLAKSEEDIAAGRTRPAREAIKELMREYNIPD